MVGVEDAVAVQKDGRSAALSRHDLGREGFRDADVDEEARVRVTTQRPRPDQLRQNVALERTGRAGPVKSAPGKIEDAAIDQGRSERRPPGVDRPHQASVEVDRSMTVGRGDRPQRQRRDGLIAASARPEVEPIEVEPRIAVQEQKFLDAAFPAHERALLPRPALTARSRVRPDKRSAPRSGARSGRRQRPRFDARQAEGTRRTRAASLRPAKSQETAGRPHREGASASSLSSRQARSPVRQPGSRIDWTRVVSERAPAASARVRNLSGQIQGSLTQSLSPQQDRGPRGPLARAPAQ